MKNCIACNYIYWKYKFASVIWDLIILNNKNIKNTLKTPLK